MVHRQVRLHLEVLVQKRMLLLLLLVRPPPCELRGMADGKDSREAGGRRKCFAASRDIT